MTVTVTSKHCGGCDTTRMESEFHRSKSTKTGLVSQCKDCCSVRNASRPGTSSAQVRAWRQRNPTAIRRYNLKRYGLTIEQYDTMFADQGGLCAICREVDTTKHAWHVDHDHATGKVRAILCMHCNRALGAIKDDPTIASRMIEYLENHGKK